MQVHSFFYLLGQNGHCVTKVYKAEVDVQCSYSFGLLWFTLASNHELKHNASREPSFAQ